jgi:hypothetical protein
MFLKNQGDWRLFFLVTHAFRGKTTTVRHIPFDTVVDFNAHGSSRGHAREEPSRVARLNKPGTSQKESKIERHWISAVVQCCEEICVCVHAAVGIVTIAAYKVVFPSQAPPAESVRMSMTGWRTRRWSVGPLLPELLWEGEVERDQKRVLLSLHTAGAPLCSSTNKPTK